MTTQQKSELIQKVWDRVGEEIEATAVDGITCDGYFSEDLQRDQRRFVKGMEIARFRAILTIREVLPE